MAEIKISEIEQKIISKLDDLEINYHDNGSIILRNKKQALNNTHLISVIVDALKKAEILETGENPSEFRIHKRLLENNESPL